MAEWIEQNPVLIEEFSDELLQLARGSFDVPVNREIARVHDENFAGIPVRVYEHEGPASGLVVYFHGGGHCIGSVALMDNVARELAHTCASTVVSVEYRLAPEHPYPAGLDDCLAVTHWVMAHTDRFGLSERSVVVAGESAGGNLAAAVALRLRDQSPELRLAGQVLMYPGVDARSSAHASREQFDGIVMSVKMSNWFWSSYSGGRDIGDDPYAAPLRAKTLQGLPPALVVLGGCDLLRDEGRAYARRLAAHGVATEEVCFAGQPHGFINLEFPASVAAFEAVGTWVRARFEAVAASTS